MSVVLLFEAQVQPGRLEAYVHYALEAQRDLAAADGCLSTEQLMAVDEARRIMVKSIWRDSASAQAWNRTNGALLAERAARLSLFEDYSVSLLCPAEFTPSAAPAPKIREAAATIQIPNSFAKSCMIGWVSSAFGIVIISIHPVASTRE